VSVVLVVAGLVGLYFGGEVLVRNASRLAGLLGVPPMAVGLTVVAFGTSAPELAATVVAAVRGAPAIAIGNVIGSNIANIGLILGLTALVYPLVTRWSFVRREVPFMVGATVVTMVLTLDGRLGALEGILLMAGLAAFVLLAFRGGPPARAASWEHTADAPAPATVGPTAARSPVAALLLALVGIGVLVAAAQALVVGAVDIAEGFGVSQRVIGLTLVAVGTSLPEMASSLVAAVRRETDIILGNVIGSNVFNLLCVLAIAALVRPMEVDVDTVRVDALVMLAFSVVVVPMVMTGLRLGRREGAVLLAGYVAYVVLLFS
jgi:cation:H+ antiporter